VDGSWEDAAMAEAKHTTRRALIHLADGRRIPVEPEEVFFLEADGDETSVRTRGRRKLRDVRSLGEVLQRFPPEVLVRADQLHDCASAVVVAPAPSGGPTISVTTRQALRQGGPH
jgi:hypothetical protein